VAAIALELMVNFTEPMVALIPAIESQFEKG
jgi:hypothetical protein